MSDRETNVERNLRRLLQTSFGPEVRTNPAMREQLRQTLLAELRPWFRSVEFPKGVLGALSGALLLPVAAWAASGLSHGLSLAAHRAWEPFAALVLLNLVSLPIASLVIILRRKYA